MAPFCNKVVWLLLILLSGALPAQQRPGEVETGLPFLSIYTWKDYRAHHQNWAALQDRRGVMYFGNSAGLLEYNGIDWRLIETDSAAAMRSLGIDGRGIIFGGAVDDLGFVSADSLGVPSFVSLLDRIPAACRHFGDVWETLVNDAGVFFRTERFLFRWAGDSMTVIRPQTTFQRAFMAGKRLYIHQPGIGLMMLSGDQLELIPDGQRFRVAPVDLLLAFDDQRLLIGSRSALFMYDGRRCTPFKSAAARFLRGRQLSHGIAVGADRFVLATWGGGAIVIDRQGNILQVLDKSSGLPDERIHHLFADRHGGVWLAMDNGLARMETPSPLTYFSSASGIRGEINAIQRHRGNLYAATSLGVFRLVYQGEAEKRQDSFQPVAGIAAAAYDLLAVDSELFAATMDGVYRIDREKGILLTTEWDRANCLAFSGKHGDRIYVGLFDGLAVLRQVGGQWQDGGRVTEISETVQTIAEAADGAVWLGTLFLGAMRLDLKINKSGVLNARVERFGRTQGLAKWTSVFTIGGQVVFGTGEGIRKLEAGKRHFVADNRFGEMFIDSTRAIGWMFEDRQQRVWIQSWIDQLDSPLREEIAITIPDGRGGYQVSERPFLQQRNRHVSSAIYPEANGVVWFGRGSEIVRYDPGVGVRQSGAFATLIRRVVATPGDSLLFAGFYSEDSSLREFSVSGRFRKASFERLWGGEITMPRRETSLRFDFVAPLYQNSDATQYQFRLEGYDRDWSPWRYETSKEFQNLPAGRFAFRVRSRNLYGHIGKEAMFRFSVPTPWHQRWWAYILYALLFAVLGYVLYRRRLTVLQRERNQLENKVHEHSRALQEKNEEIVRQQEQLMTQEQLASLGQLTAGIVHEIKNPLNFVNNFAGLSIELVQELRTELEGRKDTIGEDAYAMIIDIIDDIAENSEKINEHGKRADSIVKGMLLHSRGQGGDREPTDINQLLAEDVKLAYHSKRAQQSDFNVTIEMSLDDSLPAIVVVPQNIGRAFLNLLTNAFDAMMARYQRDGRRFAPLLTVSSHKRADACEIRIRDNGGGIPRAAHQKIFDPFYTTKPAGEGTGLGLSITQEIIVKEHQGELTFTSDGQEYSEFIIRLPLQAPPE